MKKILFAILIATTLSAQAFCPDDELPPSMAKGIDYLYCGKAFNAIEVFNMYAANDIDAQYYLGKAYLLQSKNANSEEEKKADLETAVQWTMLAAYKNHVLAQYALARLYLTGVGVHTNEILAEKWLTKASNQGHTPAQVDLASIYATAKGSASVADYVTGYAWMNIAAASGNREVKNLLHRIEDKMTRHQIITAQNLSEQLQKKIR